MSRSLQRLIRPVEVKADHDGPEDGEGVGWTVNEIHPRQPDLSLAAAKTRTGAAFREALRGRALKEFGSPSLLSEVCSGEKVPDYLARIVGDDRARRRFAMALLEHDHEARVSVSVPLS